MEKQQYRELLKLCKDNGFPQRRWARNKRGRLRKVDNRAGVMVWSEDDGEFVPKRVVVPVKSKHYVYFTERLFVSFPRSSKERVKTLEGFIDMLEANGFPVLAALVKTMRGYKHGSDVHWYPPNIEHMADATFSGVMDYVQQMANEQLSVVIG